MSRMSALALVAAAAFVLCAQSPPSASQPPVQPPPAVFKAAANYVRVDVYPTHDGQPVTDLTQNDFEIFEDKAPQPIDAFEHIVIRGNLPQDLRIEPNSVEAGRQAAQNPRARVFVVFLDVNHVEVEGSRIAFRFRGKSGKTTDVDVTDPRVARVLRRCEGLPGQHLFQYVDEDGEPVDVDSDDVNAYLREVAGGDFTAKDFRTWTGTVLAAWALEELGEAGSQTQATRQVVRAVESVAKELGNTPAVCRSAYVHPEVIETHLEGNLAELLGRRADRRVAQGMRGLTPHEAAVLALLRRRLESETRS